MLFGTSILRSLASGSANAAHGKATAAATWPAHLSRNNHAAANTGRLRGIAGDHDDRNRHADDAGVDPMARVSQASWSMPPQAAGRSGRASRQGADLLREPLLPAAASGRSNDAGRTLPSRSALLQAYQVGEARQLDTSLAADALQLRAFASAWYPKQISSRLLRHVPMTQSRRAARQLAHLKAMPVADIIRQVKSGSLVSDRSILTDAATERLIDSLNVDTALYRAGVRRMARLEGVHSAAGRAATFAGSSFAYGIAPLVAGVGNGAASIAARVVRFAGRHLPSALINPILTGLMRIDTDVGKNVVSGGMSVLAPDVEHSAHLNAVRGDLVAATAALREQMRCYRQQAATPAATAVRRPLPTNTTAGTSTACLTGFNSRTTTGAVATTAAGAVSGTSPSAGPGSMAGTRTGATMRTAPGIRSGIRSGMPGSTIPAVRPPSGRQALLDAFDTCWSAQEGYKTRMGASKALTWSKGYGMGVNAIAASATAVGVAVPAAFPAALAVQALCVPLQWGAGYLDLHSSQAYHFRASLKYGALLTPLGARLPADRLRACHIDTSRLRGLFATAESQQIALIREVATDELGELRYAQHQLERRHARLSAEGTHNGRQRARRRAVQMQLGMLAQRIAGCENDLRQFGTLRVAAWEALSATGIIGRCLDDTGTLRRLAQAARRRKPGEVVAQVWQRYKQTYGGGPLSPGIVLPAFDVALHWEATPHFGAAATPPMQLALPSDAAVAISGAEFTAATGVVRGGKARDKKDMAAWHGADARSDALRRRWAVPMAQGGDSIDLSGTGGFDRALHSPAQRAWRFVRIIPRGLFSAERALVQTIKARRARKDAVKALREAVRVLGADPVGADKATARAMWEAVAKAK